MKYRRFSRLFTPRLSAARIGLFALSGVRCPHLTPSLTVLASVAATLSLSNGLETHICHPGQGAIREGGALRRAGVQQDHTDTALVLFSLVEIPRLDGVEQSGRFRHLLFYAQRIKILAGSLLPGRFTVFGYFPEVICGGRNFDGIFG